MGKVFKESRLVKLIYEMLFTEIIQIQWKRATLTEQHFVGTSRHAVDSVVTAHHAVSPGFDAGSKCRQESGS